MFFGAEHNNGKRAKLPNHFPKVSCGVFHWTLRSYEGTTLLVPLYNINSKNTLPMKFKIHFVDSKAEFANATC